MRRGQTVMLRIWADFKDGQLADSDASSQTSVEFSGLVWNGRGEGIWFVPAVPIRVRVR
jgi:hypothetical protein